MGFNFSDEFGDDDNGEAPIYAQPIQPARRAEAVNKVVDSIFQEETEQEEIITERDALRLQARERTEQANLYMTIMDSQIFSPGSARPEILHKVEEEFKAFAGDRLAILLGIKQEAQKVTKSETFSDEEISALRAIASKINGVKETKPVVSNEPPVPKVNAIGSKQELPKPMLAAQSKPVTAKVSAPKKPKPAQKDPEERATLEDISEMSPEDARAELNRRKKASGQPAKVNSAGVDNPRKKNMPSLAEQELLYTQQMQQNASSDPLMTAITQKALRK
jgi:hypothetical protein